MDYESTDLEKTLALKIMEKYKEIERQKEIINKLEEWLKEYEKRLIKEIKYNEDKREMISYYDYVLGRKDMIFDILSKLNLLDKESNNEN